MRAFALAALLLAADAAPRPPPAVVNGESAPAYAILGGKGSARILLGESAPPREVSLVELVLQGGAAVPEHVHEASAEILHVQGGELELTIGGKQSRLGAGDAAYIPAGAVHAARVLGAAAMRATQIYTGPGPEQRFTKGTKR